MTHKERGQEEFKRVMVRLSRGEIQNPKDVMEDLSREHTEKEEFYKVIFGGKEFIALTRSKKENIAFGT